MAGTGFGIQDGPAEDSRTAKEGRNRTWPEVRSEGISRCRARFRGAADGCTRETGRYLDRDAEEVVLSSLIAFWDERGNVRYRGSGPGDARCAGCHSRHRQNGRHSAAG